MAARFDTGSMESYGAVQAAGAEITVPDAALLFTGDYSRSGSDLTITGSDGAKFVVTGYFETDTPPTLVAPTGGGLTGDVVTALAGPQFPGMYAQAGGGGAAGLKEIGKVQTLDGSASVVRANGVTETLNVGDPVYEGDVVQTGPGSKLGIGFVDGTVFSMSANARMVLNKLIFNADGQDNSMLFSLVEGSFVFASGKIAPTGDMKIQTPVATMGIRGTAPTVDILKTALGQVVNFSIVQNPGDGHVGIYSLFDNVTGALIGTISDTGSTWSLNINGTITQFEKSQDDLLRDVETINQINNVYSTYQSTSGQNPQAGPENNQPSSGLNTDPPGENNENNQQNNNNQNNNENNNENNNQQNNGGNNQSNNNPPPLVDDPDDPGVNFIQFGDGDDTITGTNGNDIIRGGGGNDHITALDGDDFVFGEDGDDTIVGGTGGGDDHYDGGEGTDTLSYESTGPGEGVTIDVTTEPGTATGAATGNDTFTSIERFIGGGGADTLKLGGDMAVYFDGGDGDDTLEFVGGFNIDADTTQIEADNFEIIDLNTTDANILTISADDVQGANANHTLRFLGNGDDTINLTNEFYANEGSGKPLEGSWQLSGETYEDPDTQTTFAIYEFHVDGGCDPEATAYVQQGIAVNFAPAIEQEIGDQSVKNGHSLAPIVLATYFMDDGGDENLEFTATQADEKPLPAWLDIVNGSLVSTLPDYSVPNNTVVDVVVTATDANGLTVQQEFTIRTGIIGRNGDDFLRGTNGDNVIAGLDGDDTIIGRRGDDQLFGDDGKDDISGDGGNDTIYGGGGKDEIVGDGLLGFRGGDDTIFGGGGEDTIIGDFLLGGVFGGNDTIDGGKGDDVIYGDSLFIDIGGGGDDTITGGRGNDTITGGGGADTYVFGPGDGTDTITDFEGIDRLDLSAFLVEPIGQNGDLGQVINDYISTMTDPDSGDTTVYVDTDGEGGAEPTAVAVLNNYDAADGITIAVDGHEPVVYTPPEAV